MEKGKALLSHDVCPSIHFCHALVEDLDVPAPQSEITAIPSP